MNGRDDARHEASERAALAATMTGQAETLWERLERAARAPSGSGRPESASNALAVWARVYAGGNQSALLKRLGWDKIDPRVAASALTADGRVSEAAPWTRSLDSFVDRETDRSETSDVQATELPFDELWKAWLEHAIDGLPAETAERFAALSGKARSDLGALFLAEISRISEAAAYEIFDSVRSSAGESVTGLYESFVDSCLADPVGAIYRHFPVLARQTLVRVEQWREMATELLARFDSDRHDLGRVFNEGIDPGALAGIDTRLSDRHGGGRQVLLVELECGLRLVYKPRSVAPEAFFAEIVAWCRERGLEPVPPVATALPRDDYGWMEFVEHEPMSSAEQASDYFQRAGALVALAHCLRARDLHAENIVATAAGPVLVDCELLLQPLRKRFSSGERLGELVTAAGSCLATGLLTHLEADAGEDRDLGGLRGWPTRSVTGTIRTRVNTDGMTLGEGLKQIDPGHNTVWVGDRFVDAAEHVDDLLAGFDIAYGFLEAHRDELRSGPLSRHESLGVRVLLRGSQEYGRVLHLVTQPRNQRSGLVGSWMHEAMLSIFVDWEDRPALWPMARDERTALEAGDIPTFWLPANETTLEVAHGEGVTGLFTVSGAEAVSQLLDGMSDEDRAFQVSQIRDSLVVWSPSGQVARELAKEKETQKEEGFEETCRRLAVAAGEELREGMSAGALERLGWTLAEGRPGIALFFAALAASEEDAGRRAGWTEAARSAVEGLEPWVERRGFVDDDLSIGGLHGIGSTIWGLVWLGRLLGDSRWLDAAGELASLLDRDQVTADAAYDLTFGAAGGIMGLLALAEVGGSENALGAARCCGEHLVERQEVLSSTGAGWRNPGGIVQTGFAHGCSGIARALTALGTATGESRFQVSAMAALSHERGLFAADRGNWPVLLRDMDGRRRRQWMVAFCRGAPGIALSRMLLPGRMQDLTVAAERTVALDTAANAPIGVIDMVCCGTLGRSWILLTAAERTGESERRQQAAALARGVVGRAVDRGFFAVSDDAFENREGASGFLKGLAGIGFQLLRLGGGTDLPDVLALELERERQQRCENPGTQSASNTSH